MNQAEIHVSPDGSKWSFYGQTRSTVRLEEALEAVKPGQTIKKPMFGARFLRNWQPKDSMFDHDFWSHPS